MRHGPNGKPAGRRREAEGAAAMIAISVVAEAYQASWATLRGVRSPGAKRPSSQHVMLGKSTTARILARRSVAGFLTPAGGRKSSSRPPLFLPILNFRMLCRLGYSQIYAREPTRQL